MTSITNGFIRTGNPDIDLNKYMEITGITDEEKAKQELQKAYGEPEQENEKTYINDLGTSNIDFISQQGNYNLALQNINYSSNNIKSDIIADDGLSRIVTHKDGSTTEFYYNAEQQILETYEKKLNDKGELEIVDYKQNTGVETNFITNNEALKNLNGRPTLSVKSAESFIKSSNIQFNEIEEFKNVANVQTDYDSEGNPSCLIMLDSDGNRIGHMWLREQNVYTTDNKVGELVMYGTGNKYQFNEDGSLNNKNSELSDIQNKVDDDINIDFKEINTSVTDNDTSDNETSFTLEQRMQQMQIMQKYKELEKQAEEQIRAKISEQYENINGGLGAVMMQSELLSALKSNHEYFTSLMQSEFNQLKG